MNKAIDHQSIDLKALQQGNRAEFAHLVEIYSPMIYRLGLKMLLNQQDAEDILQETFLKAYRHIGNFDGRSSISTWLYRIATNESLMFLRKKHPEAISIEDGSSDDDQSAEPMEIVDWCCLPEKELMTTESKAYLDHAIDQLSANLRVVFVLRDIQGLSVRETAEVLNISEMAVKTRLSRARFQLREELTQYFAERM